jgi:hypothetical protein
MSNSLPSGSAMHRHRKPSSSRVVPGSSQRPPRGFDLVCSPVEIVDDQVEVQPVLAGLGVGDALEADREAVF